MCGEETIKTLVLLAQKEEQRAPQEAAKHYLEAAQYLVKCSQEKPAKEKEFLAMAQRFYGTAQRLRKNSSTTNDTTTITSSDKRKGFSSIGGLEELKEEISFKIIEPFRNKEIYSYYGKAIGGGILMYGPPGCGKSLIAKATAEEAQATFIHVKASDIKSKFVGETEKNIAELFEKAREQQPTIIFFDEFEVLGRDRSEGQTHEKSAVAQLLTEMDGVDAKEQQILLLAATNEPWAIDPALRREGRFGTTIFIPPPDHEARMEIIKIHLAKRPTELIDYKKIADLTEGLSGADLKAICEAATDIPLKESVATGKRRKIAMRDVERAMSKIQSIIRQWFAKAKGIIEEKKLNEDFADLMKKAEEILNVKQAVVV